MSKEEQLYDLLAYIASASKEMYMDPQIYAPLRLLTVMLRLIEMLKEEKELDQDFLKELKQMIEDNQFLLSRDGEKFEEFLDKLVIKIALKNFDDF